MPYDYLVRSINKFYNQEEFSKRIINTGFIDVNIEISQMAWLRYILVGKSNND